jgi:glucoamylase
MVSMACLFYSSCALALAWSQTVLAAPDLSPRATVSLESWLATETAVSLNGILDNIGASGAYAQSAKAGVVIASPSTSSPDCELFVMS